MFREIFGNKDSIFNNNYFDLSPEKWDVNAVEISKIEELRASEVPPRPLAPKKDSENKSNDNEEGTVME